ncbi:MAG: twin-arginine translocase TatA/TatE family subunit [Solobacterium sp.]|nr:twin-arginine translocase TatA/TatE family subunit [Solobacterium sp.]
MKIGTMELIMVLFVALIVIGPDRLPEYARKLGIALKEFRKVSSEMTKDLRESVVEPLQEAQKPLKEAMEPLEQLNKDVQGDLKQVEDDFKNIGKEKKAEPEKEQPADHTALNPEESAEKKMEENL